MSVASLPWMSAPDPPRRLSPRAARVLIAVFALVFVVQVVALAVGAIEVALACAAVYVVAWFAVRGLMGRP